jgi:hypothetical protein
LLKDVGFTPRDVICLKQNSQWWWNSMDTKHKRVNHVPLLVSSTPPNKRVAFKKLYCNREGYKIYRPKMVESDCSPEGDFDWYFFCKVRDVMVPLLPGYIPVLYGESDNSEAI